ncbi:MAG: hypothetical protein J6I74_09540, partial [Schwartzia sp.]|nr:hypothetical protein [Schwartzia sp. (in: firmicutes)]
CVLQKDENSPIVRVSVEDLRRELEKTVPKGSLCSTSVSAGGGGGDSREAPIFVRPQGGGGPRSGGGGFTQSNFC